MIETIKSPKGEFRARLREVEPGVFRAEYQGEFNPDRADERRIPDYHVATSEADARSWVEAMARSMGYGPVVWE